MRILTQVEFKFTTTATDAQANLHFQLILYNYLVSW